MLKAQNSGQFLIPTSPAAGTAVAQSASANTYGAYVQMIASTANAIFITGLRYQATSTSLPTYLDVEIGTGGAGSETLVGIIPCPIVYNVNGINGMTNDEFGGYIKIDPPIPVAVATRIACKTASDAASAISWKIGITCINQADVADAGIKEQADVQTWLGTAPAALTASGYVQSILLRWLTDNAAGTPAALSASGYTQAMLLRWLTDNAGGTPAALNNGDVQSDVERWLNAVATALPTNFNLLAIDASGRVDLGKWLGSAPSALISGAVQSALVSAEYQKFAKEHFGISGTVWHVAPSGNDSTGTGLSWQAPYATLTKAQSVAASDDLIWGGPGTFSLGTNQLDLSIGHTGTIHLKGFGIGATKIVSTRTGFPCVEWGANSRITDLTIEGPLTAPPNALPLGSQGSAQKWNVWLENIEVVGGSDGIFTSSNTGGGVIRGRNIRIRAKYDCVNFSDTSHTFEFWDVDFETSGALALGDLHRAIATNASGTVHSGRLAAYHDDAARAYGIALEVGTGSTGTPTVTLMPGVVLDVTAPSGATNYYDVSAAVDFDTLYAKIICAGVIGSGPNGLIRVMPLAVDTNIYANYARGVQVRTDGADAAHFVLDEYVESATSTTVTVGDVLGNSLASATAHYYNGDRLIITQGTGIGQMRNVLDYISKTFTVDRAFATIPDNTSKLMILASGGAWASSSTVLVSPALVNANNPRYSTWDVPPIAQGSAPADSWTLIDATGAAINLGTNTVRVVGYLDTENLPDNPFDNAEAAKFKYETGGNGITISGSGTNTNVVTLQHSSNTTSVAGDYRYWLWDITRNIVLASGRMPFVPAVKNFP